MQIQPVGDRLGVGAGNEVAVDGGGDQHALALGTGTLEDHPVHQAALALVQQIVFAPVGGHLPIHRFQQFMDAVGVHPRGVDDAPGGKAALGSGKAEPALRQSLDGGDRAAAVQFHTVLDGGLDHGQGKAPGIDDAGGGGVQSAADFGGEGRFHGTGFLPGQQPQLRHAVGHAPAVQRFQRGPVLGGEAHHQ